MKATWLACATLVCAASICAPGCPGRSDKPTAAAPTPPEAVYTVRGRIAALPDPAKPASEFRVEHEPIDNFVGQNGKIVGMSSMTMGFPLAKGVSLAGLAVGDIVELTFEVRWKSQPHAQTTRVTKLPPDTPLHLGKANPPG